MSYELKIVGGTVVDGTGGAPRRADVAIADGRIVAVGDCAGAAERTIDADGAIVTPGFVDIHTHYDGQATWDETLVPSIYHGVTTAIMGSCGVGFAPCREGDRTRLIELMEGVEDIPGAALAEGIKWSWESFAGYLDALDAMPRTMDIAAHVPHDAVRVYVMGERGAADELATDDDVAAMRDVVRASLEAGAVGFSTGRTDNHLSVDGSATPASEASIRELQGIAQAFHGMNHGVLQAVSDFDMAESLTRFDAEFDVLEQMAAASGGHPLSISLLQRNRDTEQWRKILGRAEKATASGTPIRVQVAARGIGVMLGLEATFHPFIGFPSYKRISQLPLADRVAAMRDPEFKAQLLTEKSDNVAGDGSNIPPIADMFLQNIEFVAMRLYRFTDDFDYEPPPSASILAEAFGTGRSVLEVIYDAMLEDDGHTLLYFPIFNYLEQNLDVVGEMLRHPLALAGLSDGGAHVGTVCDASFPSYMLMHWARDRDRDQLPLERVVQMLSADNARYLGLKDRGIIAPGMRADLNVIDHAGLRLDRPKMHHDLPAGGRRLIQRATGYRATIVGGQVVVEADELTGARPGRLVRFGR